MRARELLVRHLKPGMFLPAFGAAVTSVSESLVRAGTYVIVIGAHELHGIPADETVVVGDHLPEGGELVTEAANLKPGDRSIVHGGLTVVFARPCDRRAGLTEIDFCDDDGNPSTWFVESWELLHVWRPAGDDEAEAYAGLFAEDYDESEDRW